MQARGSIVSADPHVLSVEFPEFLEFQAVLHA